MPVNPSHYWAVYQTGVGTKNELVGEYIASSITAAIRQAKSDVLNSEGINAVRGRKFKAIKGAVKTLLRDKPPAFRGPRRPLSMGGNAKKNPIKILRTKPVRVQRKMSGEQGTALAKLSDGWVRVKWDDRPKATLIQADEITRMNPGRPIHRPYNSDEQRRAERRKERIHTRMATAKSRYVKSGDRDAQERLLRDYNRLQRELAKVQDLDNLRKYGKTEREMKRNPSVTAMSKMFQGAASGKTETLKAASSAPANLARIGKLAALKVEGKRGHLRIPGAVVAVDTKGKLWLTGKSAPMMATKAKPGQGLDYGEIVSISYVTAKAHVGGGKTYEYVHAFGEDGGKRPHLIVDHEGMPIIKGGDYRIKAEGIID